METLKEYEGEKKFAYNNQSSDLAVAAGLSLCHFPVRIDSHYNVMTAEQDVTFHFPQKCLEDKRFSTMLKAQLSNHPSANYNFQREEMKMFFKAVTICRNEDLLWKMVKREIPSLAYNKETWGLTESNVPLPGYKGESLSVRTGDPALTIILMTLGYPLLSIGGSEGNTLYHIGGRSVISHFSEPLPSLVKRYREGVLAVKEPEHDLLILMTALHHKRALQKEVRRTRSRLVFSAEDVKREKLVENDDFTREQFVRGAGKGISAIISDDASPSQIEKAEKYVN